IGRPPELLIQENTIVLKKHLLCIAIQNIDTKPVVMPCEIVIVEVDTVVDPVDAGTVIKPLLKGLIHSFYKGHREDVPFFYYLNIYIYIISLQAEKRYRYIPEQAGIHQP